MSLGIGWSITCFHPLALSLIVALPADAGVGRGGGVLVCDLQPPSPRVMKDRSTSGVTGRRIVGFAAAAEQPRKLFVTLKRAQSPNFDKIIDPQYT